MSTNLDVKKWCDSSLFHIENFKENIPNLFVNRVKFNNDLTISKACKLINLAI
jgi:hypothetical protein